MSNNFKETADSCYASKRGIKKINGVYYLIALKEDSNDTVRIPIDDVIFETIGTTKLSNKQIQNIYYALPSSLFINFTNGYWKIQNEGQLFSDILSKIL